MIMDFRLRLRPLAALTLASLLGTLVSSAAFAQSADDRATARVIAEDADKKVQAGDYTGAVDSFTKAFALVPAPTIKVARAHAYLKLSHLIEAQQDLIDAARSAPQPGEPASWGDARKKAQQEADAITPRLPLANLQVSGAPLDQVTVTVDGEQVPNAALGAPRVMNPGTHSVRAAANGYTTAEQPVTVAEGDRKNVALVLTAIPSAVPAVPAPVPSAIAPAPGAMAPPPPDAASAQPPPAQPATAPTPPPEHPDNTLSTLGYVGVGVFGAAGVATGIVALVQASDVKGQCNGNSCPASAQGEANSSSTMGTISTVAFVVAGGSLLLGLLTHHSSPKAATAATIDFSVGPGTIGAVGRF
jgi:hypothetical protein